MGRKKSQKNKTEGSQQQQQQQQAQQQQSTPPQPTPGPSGDPGTLQPAAAKEVKSKKRLEAQQQKENAGQQPQFSLEQKQEEPVHQPTWQQRGPPPPQRLESRERRQDQQRTQQAAPSSRQAHGAWQRGPPQLQHEPPQRQQLSSSYSPSQQQAAFPQDGRRGSQQSTPSSRSQQQPGTRDSQKRAHGRGTGRGWQKPQEPGQRQTGPSQSQQPWQRQYVQQQQVESPIQSAWQQQRGQQQPVSRQMQPSFQPPQQTSEKTAGGVSQAPTPKQHGSQLPTEQKVPGQEQPTTSDKPSPPLDLVIPQRKKLKSAGTAGRKISIETNHLVLTFPKRDSAIHYDVTIEPDKPKRLLRDVMEAFRKINYPNCYPAFDGAKNLFSSSELPFDEHINGEVTIEEDERPKTFKVTINIAARIDLSVLRRYFEVTNRAMTPNQTSAMIRRTATSTSERKERIMDAIGIAGFNQNESAQEFGISVNENFEKITARVLDAPPLSYANKNVRPQRSAWYAGKFKDGKSLHKWCIFCVDRIHPQALQEFADMMIQQGEVLGMQIAKPTILPPVRLTFRREKQEIEQCFRREDLKEMQLILVVINEYKETYFYVKQVAELRVGTLTQCVRGRNVPRPKQNTVKNILLKINAKLNGVNHTLQQPLRCLDLKKPTMIMGADVTHPSPENKGTVPSVAAVTASHDVNAFQYNICWRLQKSGQEIILDLADIVKEHLLFFYKKNGGMRPGRIIFFRDGVSEGQFQTVLNAEVHAIRQACKNVQDDGKYNPEITFLVVQKRHHTRLFPMNPKDSEDRNGNVPAGTVVDTEITHPTALDFYLVSHASIQGVARPTKYRMLWDDSDMTEDELEQLTFHLCHMFTRCTRSVSYPAPTYYAHLAAARAKVYCEMKSIDLNNLQREQEQLAIKSEIVKGLPMYFV